MSAVAETALIWDLPHERNGAFVGRDDLLTEVHKRMAGGDRVQVLLGLGGIGKTQAAVEYAYRFKADYALVWWVSAQGESSILLAYEKLADRLGQRLSPRSSPAVAVEMLDALLAGRRYLLVYDGADDARSLQPLLPTVTGGHVLITSRQPGWDGVAHARPMRVMSRDESVAFLRKRTGSHDVRDVEKVAATLGDLPLAMEQASAVIAQGGLSFTDYLRRFETQWASMLGEGLRPVDYPRSVAMTWSLAFDGVEKALPVAADLLHFASFVNSDRVTLQLLRDGAGSLFAGLRGLADDPRLWDAAVATLRSFSLVEAEEGRAFGMHRLVAAVTRDRLSESAQRGWCMSAVEMLAGLFKFDSGNIASWAPCAALLPHVVEATGHAERLGVATQEGVELLNDAGRYLLRRAQFTEARGLLERALRLCDQLVGPTDPKRSSITNNLGRVHDHLGENDRAIELYSQAIAIDTATYGDSHPHVAEVVNNYGVALVRKGDLETARKQFEWAARIYESHHGPDHPKMAQILNNLGHTLRGAKDRDVAHEKLRRALYIAEGSVGPRHPTTARILFNMADVYASEGHLTDAREHLERALSIDEAALGATHPTVASDCDSLATVLMAMGQPSLAAPYLGRVADIRRGGTAALPVQVAREAGV